jgi:hypothetical protein
VQADVRRLQAAVEHVRLDTVFADAVGLVLTGNHDMSDIIPTAPPNKPTFPDGYTQWSFWILAATILLLGVTVLVQALTGHAVAVQVIVGLALVAALLTFLPRVTDVERFAMNRSGVTLDLVRGQVAEANAKLDRFIFLAMPKPTYANLVKLAGPQRFGRYNITEGFQAQLRFLRDAGYITLDRYVGELQDGDDLSTHVQVTDLGKEFIANRRRLVPNEQL